MYNKRRWIWVGLLIALVFLTACGSPAEEGGSDQAGSIPENISCEVFYRPAPGASFEESTLTLSTATGQGANSAAAAFEDMQAEATFFSDTGEGKSLSFVVTDLATGAELTRGLYQFDPRAGVRDQFIGGHGFTGLVYVYHPQSDGEIQYFCAAGT